MRDLSFESVVQFIDLEIFSQLSEFPRCPNSLNLTLELHSINRDESFMVFISHCWLRSDSTCLGWDGTPHPDNVEHDKFKLCVEGIKILKERFAPKMKKCFVWLDYACIDQDNRANLPKTLKQYDKIVQCCDCIFTPIADKCYRWKHCDTGNPFRDYRSMWWDGDHPQAYINRAWCRVEMMYAANIPLLGNSNGVERHNFFEFGLAHHCKMNRRPHFVFGSNESREQGRGPRFLAPLQRLWFEEYHPLKGLVSVKSDLSNIAFLVAALEPFIVSGKVDAKFSSINLDEKWQRNRVVVKHIDDDVYEGEWESDGDDNGWPEGWGRYTTADGEYYEGQFKAGMMDGRGVYHFDGGELYDGEWKNDEFHGKGVHYTTNGTMFGGEWEAGQQVGQALNYYSTGDVYEGEYGLGWPDGRGIKRYADGHLYRGHWKGAAGMDMESSVWSTVVYTKENGKSM